MKFSCTQENLHRGLGLVSHIAAKNTNLPILQNILIEATDAGVSLVGTNLEIGVRVRVRGKVEDVGSYTVPAGVFNNYVGLVTAEKVDIEQDDEKTLHVHAGNQHTKINGEAASEFPLIPDIDKTAALKFNIQDLKTALSQVLVAVSVDDTRPELTGVYVSFSDRSMVLASTDSYRLAERRVQIVSGETPDMTTIIPGNALRELVRILPDAEEEDIEIFFSDSQVLFMTPTFELTSRLIEGVFPDYQQIIPTEFRTTVVFERDELTKAVKAASLFSKSGIHDVSIQFDPEKQGITISSVNAQLGENVTKVNAEINGEENTTIFNYRYLLDGLSQVRAERVQLSLVDSMTPGVFAPQGSADEGYMYIIMPIKQ